MLTAIIINLNLWVNYFIIYTIILLSIIVTFNTLKINNLKQIFFIDNKILKYILIIIFLSVAGLPPFRGFLAKYLVILAIGPSTYKILMIPLILTTLISLFFYIRITLINIFTVNSKFYTPLILKTNNNKIFVVNLIGLLGGWVLFI